MNVALLPHLFALVLAAIHPIAPKLRFLDVVPRSRWLSFAGGVSIAYVFVHVLPDLHETQRTLEESGVVAMLGFVETHAYLVALLGLCFFYGLEQLALRSRARNRAETGADETEPQVFWIHVGSFGVYNALIGYLLLHREVRGSV
jgi:hypothetical protein